MLGNTKCNSEFVTLDLIYSVEGMNLSQHSCKKVSMFPSGYQTLHQSHILVRIITHSIRVGPALSKSPAPEDVTSLKMQKAIPHHGIYNGSDMMDT